jgi:hypothetical protein
MEAVRKTIESHGGVLLDDVYKNASIKMKMKCANGHVFLAKYNDIQQGHWCNECADDALRNSEQEVVDYIKSRDGELLSRYKNSYSKIRIRCSAGHEWETMFKTVIRGSWCRYCGGTAPLQEDDVRKFIEDKGGKLLSGYKSDPTKILVECNRGHRWHVNFGQIKIGHWCPECMDNTFDIDEVRADIGKRGGVLLSDKYINSKTKILIRGKCGHEFWTIYHSVRQGHWCTYCHREHVLRREPKVRRILETVFSKKFPSVRVLFMKSPHSNRSLEIDCYNDEMKLAVEVNGSQHYKFNKRFHKTDKDLLKQQERDASKRAYCKKNGIFLLEIPYNIPESGIETYIRSNAVSR